MFHSSFSHHCGCSWAVSVIGEARRDLQKTKLLISNSGQVEVDILKSLFTVQSLT